MFCIIINAKASVFRMQRDFRYPTVDKFDVYWNVPSFMCQKYGINFTENTKRWGIVANEGDAFRGEKMIILYDPGAFPAVLKVRNNLCLYRVHQLIQVLNIKTIPGLTRNG